jgi:allantoinase
MTIRAFQSRQVVTPEGVRPAALLVEEELIRAVVGVGEIPADAHVVDFGDAAILPGLVDSHVHINEPGRTEWEGFETATRAAAAGGYTFVVDMPLNCSPATISGEAMEAKRKAAQGQCLIDWGAWGGVVADNQSHLQNLTYAGVLGFKCFLIHSGIDDFAWVNEAQLRAALPHVAKSGLPLLVHAELADPIKEATARLANADWNRYATYLCSRPDEAELAAIRMMIALCREYPFHLHIVHLATWRGLELLAAARAEGLPVTVETCPHYLHLTAETIDDGATECKCAPPVRGRENRERLWQGLRDGVIDMIVTDHSPCPPSMKQGDFRSAWGGIASLSLALPVIWTEARARGFALSDVARWMADEPGKLARGIRRKGQLKVGGDADFVVFDSDAEFTVTKECLHHRHQVSPYLGETLRGVVKATYLRGKPVFTNGEFTGQPRGEELRMFWAAGSS